MKNKDIVDVLKLHQKSLSSLSRLIDLINERINLLEYKRLKR